MSKFSLLTPVLIAVHHVYCITLNSDDYERIEQKEQVNLSTTIMLQEGSVASVDISQTGGVAMVTVTIHDDSVSASTTINRINNWLKSQL